MPGRSRVRSRIHRLFLMGILSAGLFHAAEASGAQLLASWVDNSGGRAMTRVERRAASEATYTAVADAPPGATTFLDTSVAPGATYCYRVFAWVEDGVSPYSSEVCRTSVLDTVKVSVTKSGTGSGTVVSTPAGINCGTACSGTIYVGTLVTLTATPAAGSVFKGWSGGGCTGTAPCVFATNASVAVTASFAPTVVLAPAPPPPSPTTYTLSVVRSGPGVVTSGSAINCGTFCTAKFASSTTVTLTAMPKYLNVNFLGWGGACSGQALTCTLTMNGNKSVTATFKIK
jgi:hypothetical protein